MLILERIFYASWKSKFAFRTKVAALLFMVFIFCFSLSGIKVDEQLDFDEPVTTSLKSNHPLFNTYAGLFLDMVDTDEGVTMFAPSNAALLQISSIFQKFPKKRDDILDYLEQCIGYVTVPRVISSKLLKSRHFLREESINGYGILLKHGRKYGFEANGVPFLKMDIRVNRSIVHVLHGLIGPLELEQRIAIADPSDLDPQMNNTVAEEWAKMRKMIAMRRKKAPKKVKDWDYDEDEDEEEEGEGISSKENRTSEFTGSIQLSSGSSRGFQEEDSDERNMETKVKEGHGFLEVEGGKKERDVGLVGKFQVLNDTAKGNSSGVAQAGEEEDYDEDYEDEDEEDEDDELQKYRNEGEKVLGMDVEVKPQIEQIRPFSWVNSFAKYEEKGERNINVNDTSKESTNNETSGVQKKAELRGTRLHDNSGNLKHVRATVVCSGRGKMADDGVCECSPLFHGSDCNESRILQRIGVEPYPDDLLMSREILFDELFSLDRINKKNGTGVGIVLRGKGQLAHVVTSLAPAQRVELKRGLPPYDPLEATFWDSCAVVGSSSSLLLQELGEEIDSHQAVFRFNGAPTYGYEKQVGRKTTIRISNVGFAGFREGNETIIYHLWLRKQEKEILRLLKFKRMFPREPFLLLELGFISSVFGALGFVPSIGYVGWAFALQKCRRVDLYGFYMGVAQGLKHHYYSATKSSKGTQDLEKEFVAAIDVAESELIWFAEVCLYDCRRSFQRCSMCLRVPFATMVERSAWTKEQVELNSLRDERWAKFLNWEQVEKKRGQEALVKKRNLRSKRRPKRHKPGKKPSLLEEWDEEWEVPWDRIISEGRLGELSLRELLLYFRQFHVTVPPTRLHMMQTIRSHYFFMRRDLSRNAVRLYKVSDS